MYRGALWDVELAPRRAGEAGQFSYAKSAAAGLIVSNQT